VTAFLARFNYLRLAPELLAVQHLYTGAIQSCPILKYLPGPARVLIHQVPPSLDLGGELLV
jgi:hypothetical protein